MPAYSIVGKAPGGNDVELDLTANGSRASTTYAGGGGVAVGSFFNKLMYAVKFGDSNFLLSGRVGPDSRVLYYRNPVQRVEKVAPWLTLDSDSYPTIVDGKVLWVVDGYTTTDQYPQAQRESFQTMTTDSQTQPSGVRTLPTDQVNYVRNAVKATVDAYTGKVTLYAWDDTDPMLEAWRSAFPNTVLDKDQIPADLLPHLRYPEDMFKVQRYQYARYHVTDAERLLLGHEPVGGARGPGTHRPQPDADPDVQPRPGERASRSGRCSPAMCRAPSPTSSASWPPTPTRRRRTTGRSSSRSRAARTCPARRRPTTT